MLLLYFEQYTITSVIKSNVGTLSLSQGEKLLAPSEIDLSTLHLFGCMRITRRVPTDVRE